MCVILEQYKNQIIHQQSENIQMGYYTFRQFERIVVVKSIAVIAADCGRYYVQNARYEVTDSA